MSLCVFFPILRKHSLEWVTEINKSGNMFIEYGIFGKRFFCKGSSYIILIPYSVLHLTRDVIIIIKPFYKKILDPKISVKI